MKGGVYLEIDASELNNQVERLRQVLTPQRVNQVMYGIFKRTGGHVRKILKQDLPKEYYVKAADIGKAVKNPIVTGGGTGGTGCIIPVSGPRRSIGGGFSASGGAHGWQSTRRKYRVKARIVKSGQSTLPTAMESYGGMPPFRNLSAKSLNGVTFTRKGKSRFPIMKVEGISIAQMPKNRSEKDVQDDIKRYMMQRMEHEIQRLIGG